MVKSFQDKTDKHLFIDFHEEIFQAVCIDHTPMMSENNFLSVFFPKEEGREKGNIGVYSVDVDYVIFFEA